MTLRYPRSDVVLVKDTGSISAFSHNDYSAYVNVH